MGNERRMRQFHHASIREITPPKFDARGEHGTVSMISELLAEHGQPVGQLEVVANFDFLFKHVVESGWWQSNKAFLVDERGRILVCTIPGRHGMIYDTDDPLEEATFKAMANQASGTIPGEGHPPSEISGFYRLEQAPWFLVMIAPGGEILSPIIQFRWIYSIFAFGFIVVIVVLIRVVTGRLASEIQGVSEAALRLSQGEFGDSLPVRSHDEVGELTRSFNLMASQLKERLHLKEAMSLAMEVQQNLLPTSPPPVPGLDLAGLSLYCQETGGDYFDYIPRPGPDGSPRLCVAVGDVVGGMMLAHKASYEGKIAAEVIAGKPSAFDARAIPAVVYTDPQIAWCGITEDQARRENLPVKVQRFPWKFSGRATTMGAAEGLTKIIADAESGRILGVGITGRDTEGLISEGVLAIEMGALAEDMAASMHPHPTLSETEGEAAELFFGHATHIMGKVQKK
jgi:HAMP domain-containing protein